MDFEGVVQRFVGVWNERDAGRRRKTIEGLWSPDGRHLMGGQDVRGFDALYERVTASNQWNVIESDCFFRPATSIQALPGVAKFHWDMVRRDTEEVVALGVGFLIFDAEGRISCNYLFAEN
jgi:hypothetical protein